MRDQELRNESVLKHRVLNVSPSRALMNLSPNESGLDGNIYLD